MAESVDSGSRTTAVDDIARLEAWLAECERHPGRLPGGVVPVQTRLIRAVGRGELPSGRAVYLKTMGFPRLRDRLRYLLRRLPAVHEARVLALLARHGVPCPVIERVVAGRSALVPRVSVLCTRELPLADAPLVDFVGAAACLARLAALGVFYPDPHRGNFLHLAGAAGVAVLDLQSARLRARPLAARARRHMAAKLMHHFSAASAASERALDPAEFVRVGLLAARDLPPLQAAVQRLRIADHRRRVQRCFTTSTEFVVERGLGETRYRRRAITPDARGVWLATRDARELWVGDRFAELFDRAAPVLGAMFHKSWWRPGLSAVYIPGGDGTRFSSEQAPRLLAAARRFWALGRVDGLHETGPADVRSS